VGEGEYHGSAVDGNYGSLSICVNGELNRVKKNFMLEAHLVKWVKHFMEESKLIMQMDGKEGDSMNGGTRSSIGVACVTSAVCAIPFWIIRRS